MVAAARCAAETSIVNARAPIHSATQRTRPRPITSTHIAPSFSTAIRVRESGSASSRSSVPRSSSPAIEPAPLPTEATRKSAGNMKEKSSLPR